MRGKGIGTEIIKESFDLADGDVKLHVDYNNKEAIKLYKKLGMKSNYMEMRYKKG
jgi:ribosomal protein S18 acetylase RimI-like enzyme